MKTLLSILIVFLMSPFFVGSAMAVNPPDFSACSNPQGTLTTEYGSGIHGIPGDLNAYTGSDKVYTIDGERFQQCFCSTAGNGIQTNWWRVGSLNQEEIDTFVKLNWHYVPDGSVWGLKGEPYMAYNSFYSCTSSTSSSGGSGNGESQGTVQAASIVIGSVLGLAGTGDIVKIYLFTIFGFVSIFLGILFRRKLSR